MPWAAARQVPHTSTWIDRAVRGLTAKGLLGLLSLVLAAGALAPAQAHYQLLIPSDDVVTHKERRAVDLEIRFTHPFEDLGVPMATPQRMGVWVAGRDQDLLAALRPVQVKDRAGEVLPAFTLSYRFRKPGDHLFYVVPRPFWDEAEEIFLIQYTKVVVNTFGLEEGWDRELGPELGMEAEIVPLTRPYGLWTGNVFQGIAKLGGRPVPFARVAVEYYNQDGGVRAPADPFITQVIKADANGVFTYVMPRAGWWGFSALVDDSRTMEHNGKAYPLHVGAVIWVKTHDME